LGLAGDGVAVRRVFHKLRSTAIENFNEPFKGIFDGHGQVPTKGLRNTVFCPGRYPALPTGALVPLSAWLTAGDRPQSFLGGGLMIYDHASISSNCWPFHSSSM
jgi:hypothetical protein